MLNGNVTAVYGSTYSYDVENRMYEYTPPTSYGIAPSYLRLRYAESASVAVEWLDLRFAVQYDSEFVYRVFLWSEWEATRRLHFDGGCRLAGEQGTVVDDEQRGADAGCLFRRSASGGNGPGGLGNAGRIAKCVLLPVWGG
jgi:hypothetical protein